MRAHRLEEGLVLRKCIELQRVGRRKLSGRAMYIDTDRIYLAISLSLSIHPSIHLSIHPSINEYMHCIIFFLYLYLFIYRCVRTDSRKASSLAKA